ncbi:hypothetical protein RFI_23992, partial [Reticulomyxa filosa]
MASQPNASGGSGYNSQENSPRRLVARSNAENDPKLFKWYFGLLTSRFGVYVILAFWLVVLIVSMIYGPKLVDLTEVTSSSPSHTRGHRAKQQFTKYFPTTTHSSECYVCILFYFIYYYLFIYFFKLFKKKKKCIRNNVKKKKKKEKLCDIASSDEEYTNCMTITRERLLSVNKHSAIGVLLHHKDLGVGGRADLMDFLDRMKKKIKREHKGHMMMSYTGEVALLTDVQNETRDTIVSHAFVIPIILLIFAVTVRSWRLTIIP